MSTARVATWNVQRGGAWREISMMLAAESVDLALLQECDVGMARSGNVHVPRMIAEAWPDADYVMAIEFEEEGLGNAEEVAELAGRWPDVVYNHRGLHCNAIVGRDLPFMSHTIALTTGKQWRGDKRQPRSGGRCALIVRWHGTYFVTAHLENRAMAEDRSAQLRRLFRSLDKLSARRVVVGADLNCKMREDQDLFNLAHDHGYSWRDANDDTGRWVGRRLDWFLYRGVEVSNPRTVDATGVSDHDLMTVDILV